MEAVAQLDAFRAVRGVLRALASMHREHFEAFIEDQLARLRPASAVLRDLPLDADGHVGDRGVAGIVESKPNVP